MNKIIIIVLMIFMPILAFPQYRSVVMVFQLETTEETVPTLFYMFQDSVIYDLGKGKEGFYNECIPAKMVNTDAAFAIQVDNKWEKIVTVGQLEEQGVYSDGTITLTLLEITRIPRDAPDDPREYKTPPNPYHRALLSDDGFPFSSSNWDSYQLLLVASSAIDSLYCSSFLPKRAIDGTYYTDNLVLKYPKASCKDMTMDSLRLELCKCFHEFESEKAARPLINNVTFVVDERGIIRGLFLFVEKEKKAIGRNVAKKILYRFQNERFHPAKDWITEKPVPDLVEFIW